MPGYVESLSVDVRSFLNDTVDWEHEGDIEKEIADSMPEGWEQARYLKLAKEDFDDMKSKPESWRSDIAFFPHLGWLI